MASLSPLTTILAIAGITIVLSTIPFMIAAIGYRQRDNGLAYLLLVSGVGVWNAMFVAQLLTNEPLIQVFFLSLSVVGAVQAGLGFFLFATTASSTPTYLNRRYIYGLVGILGGLDIILAVTAPVHQVYWALEPGTTGTIGFASVAPSIGYWFHTVLLVGLFGAGVILFNDAWRDYPTDPYFRAYVIAGTVTIGGIVGSSIAAPGGLGVGSILAVSLTAIGWLQASRGDPLAWVQGVIQ